MAEPTGRVEVVLGDLFDSDARILVAPCGADGSMSAENVERVQRLGLRPPAGPLTVGQILAAPADGRTVLFATAVRADRHTSRSSAETVRAMAGEIGRYASDPDTAVAMPLLGVGAGGLPPDQSMRALTAGFAESAHPTATLRIHVLEVALVELLRPLLTETPDKTTSVPTFGGFLDQLARRFPDGGRVRAGAVAAAIVTDVEGLAEAGPERTLEEHFAAVAERWSPRRLPVPGPEHLILGLAMDDGVGWPLLRAGEINRLGAMKRLPWDLLSATGRELAEDQPLLASALGAPAEWSARLPATATLLAFSPRLDRVAALAGTEVHETGADGRTRRLGTVDGRVVSLGWGREGLLALRLDDGVAEIVRVGTGTVVGRATGVTDGLLAAGAPAWLARAHDIVRWWGPDRTLDDQVVPTSAALIAVDGSGRRALLGTDKEAAVVSTLTEDQPSTELTARGTASARIPWQRVPHALVSVDKRIGIAAATDAGHIVLSEPGGPPIARLLTGGAIDALAADGPGSALAVANGDLVSVWPVGRSRPVSRGVAGYEPDSVRGTDLLDADRDASALASLIASAGLRPPLAVGLFGEWGSGKTFVLDRIVALLEQLADTKDEGYVGDIVFVPFNAWHYAETNLWASLVDQVLRKIAPPDVKKIPEIEDADRRAADAAQEVKRVETELGKAKAAVEKATARLARRRRVAWAAGGVALLLAAAAVATVSAGQSAGVVATISAVTALLGYFAAATVQFRNARAQAAEFAEAGRAGMAAFARLTAAEATRAAAARLQDVAEEERAVRGESVRLAAEADRLRRQAEADQTAAVLGQLSTVTEYRDQLSLVTRTRDLFSKIDEELRKDKRRVVIAIDDLDRCAAEKVVQVLEAVHLLFNFEMFVVLLAVDTRWLDQSLRIRYHQLLGGSGGATPSDYLEKIIQIPVRLVPLDEGLVRQMITGLTGRPVTQRRETPSQPATPGPEPARTATPQKEPEPQGRRYPRAPRRRLPAKVLEITEAEAAAMSAVAPLIGTTPRTVKRFVNTYRLLKARVKDPGEFDHPRGGIGDHEVVAFLLAVITGRPTTARALIDALAAAPENVTLGSALADPDPAVRRWLTQHPRFDNAPAHRFAEWAPEVTRFSFVRTAGDTPGH
ncbi:hypothetical protein GCM10009687_47920 [Asanoa iriomotensis]|uniref:P-loop NTPase fold protein n=1 Tax=Asanoa iriomotensis TaxID=234613 RepID=UPI0031D1D55D